MMKPTTISLRIIIPSIIFLTGLIFFSAVYLQINHNLKIEVAKTSLHQTQQIMTALQRAINIALAESDWNKAEKELLAVADNSAIENLFLIEKNNTVLLANKLSLKNQQYTDEHLKIFFKDNVIKPFVTNINDQNIIAIYPIVSLFKEGELPSAIQGALYLNYSTHNNMTQFQSIFHENIWLLFIIMALILILVTIILHKLVVYPIEFLADSIRQDRHVNAQVMLKLKGKREFSILVDEFNKREQLISQQFEKIKEKEALLDRAQEISHFGICKRELNSKKMTCSDELYRIFDRPKGSALANCASYEHYIHPFDKDRYSTLLRQLHLKPAPYTIEYRIILPDESIRFIREQGEKREDSETKQLNLVSVIQDISLQEQAKNFIEISPVIIFRWKAEDNWPVDFVTENISQFGYSSNEFTSGQIKFNNIIHPDDQEKVNQEVKQYTQDKRDEFTQEYRIITHNGEVKWIDDRTTVERNSSGEVLYFTGAILDITHTKMIKNQFIALGEIVSNSLNEVYVFDKETLQFTYLNHSAEINIGYSLSEMKKMTPIDIKPEISAEQFLSLIKPLDNEPDEKIVFETVQRRKNNSDYFVEVHLQLIIFNERAQYVAFILDISKRKESLKSLANSEKKYRQLVENLRDNYFFYTHDKEGVFTFLSDSITNILGYSKQEFLNHFDTFLTNDPMNKKILSYTEKGLQGHKQLPYRLSIYHKDGSIRYIEVTEVPLINMQNEVIGIEGIAKDITKKYHNEQGQEEQQNFLQSIIDGIPDPVMVIDKNYQVKLMNKPIRDTMNLDIISDIKNPKCYEVSHKRTTPCDGNDHICPLSQVISEKKAVTVIHNHSNPQGKKIYLELSNSPLWDHKHNLIGMIESARDITDHMLVQDELRQQKNILSFQATHDNLTQLPNRLLLTDRLDQTLKKAQRNKQKVALMFIDLDHFKEINDSLGHNIGDEILKETAIRLQLSVRETDTVARLGGDEFTVLLENINDDDVVSNIALKIITIMQDYFSIDNHTLYVTTSIGISLYPDDTDNANGLLKNADAAMYKAKEEGRNTYQFYTEDMTQKALEHIIMESNLRHALNNNEFTVYYQPQVNGKTNEVIGMEALVRWLHPEQGLISPARFIPLAEKTGLIIPLGKQIFDIATKQMALWMEQYALSGRMAINLSVKQFKQANLFEVLSETLQKNNCLAKWIELEITENYVMDNPEHAISILQELQDFDFEIAIDDFGTGYSSLSYLKRLPINKLKIDQSFVRDLMIDENDKVIITSTISLAKNMKLNVIAEGVETIEQKNFLLGQGCEMIQGYYYSRPLPKEEMNKLLSSPVFNDS